MPYHIEEDLSKRKAAPTTVSFKMKHNSFIIQKYIERPFLIFNRKFDIRVWTFLNYDGCFYIFKLAITCVYDIFVGKDI